MVRLPWTFSPSEQTALFAGTHVWKDRQTDRQTDQTDRQTDSSMVLILGYWDIRGLAHAIRLLLEYTETPYEEKQYNSGEASDFDNNQLSFLKKRLNVDFPSSGSSGSTGWLEWQSEKNKLGLDFPNLPYIIDGENRISQSNAILRYIARKHKMCGESEEEQIRIDMLENQIMDFRMGFAGVCYRPDFEKLKPGYLEQLPAKLQMFSHFLGNRQWFAGDKITFIDFLAYDILDVHRMFEPKCLDQFANLKDFLDRFEALEKISAYMNSGRYLKNPVFWRIATWK